MPSAARWCAATATATATGTGTGTATGTVRGTTEAQERELQALFAAIGTALATPSAEAQCDAASALSRRFPCPAERWAGGWDGCAPSAALRGGAPPGTLPDTPSLPAGLRLVSPREDRRRPADASPAVYLLHSIAHIELNAVQLYLDTAARFVGSVGGPPAATAAFIADTLSIAADEARHFGWLQARLAALGSTYGALPGHTGLWEAGASTRGSLPDRLAVVPLVLEARALDSADRLVHKLRSAGDTASADLVRTICNEEVRHVERGVYWFRHAAVVAGLVPHPPHDTDAAYAAAFQSVLRRCIPAPLPTPFNVAARTAATFPAAWYGPLGRQPMAAGQSSS